MVCKRLIAHAKQKQQQQHISNPQYGTQCCTYIQQPQITTRSPEYGSTVLGSSARCLWGTVHTPGMSRNRLQFYMGECETMEPRASKKQPATMEPRFCWAAVIMFLKIVITLFQDRVTIVGPSKVYSFFLRQGGIGLSLRLTTLEER